MVGVLIFPDFSEFEVTVALSLTQRDKVCIIGVHPEPVTSESGLTCVPDTRLEHVNAETLEALIIPGGDMVHLKDAEALFSLLQQLDQRKALLAAICSGPYALARAGVLEGKPYTVTIDRAQRDILGCFDERTFRYAPVVTVQNIITAQGHAFVEFGLEVARALNGGVQDETAQFYRGQANSLMEADRP